MLKLENVWSRVCQRSQFVGKKQTDFGIQVITLRYDGLTAGSVVTNQAINFPNGAVIMGITGGAWQTGGESPAVLEGSGLSLFALSMDYQQNRSIIGTARTLASALFGIENDLFPAAELMIPTQGQLIYSFESTAPNTISITIDHHCLVPLNIG